MPPTVIRMGFIALALVLIGFAETDAQTVLTTTQPVSAPAPKIAWRGCVPDSAELTAAAQDLARQNLSGREFIRRLIELAGLDPAFVAQNSPFSLPTPAGLSIAVMFPLPLYATSASEAIRKREPVAAVTVPTGIVIEVAPKTIDAPDIIKVVVERDGREIAPALNRLQQTEFTTRMGVKFTRHAGGLLYPCSAFDLGGTVTITAIPESGENMTLSITDRGRFRFWPQTDSRVAAILKQDEELAAGILKQEEERAAAIRKQDDERAIPIRSRPASALLRMTAADVKALFGPPAKIEGTRWTYLASDDSGDQLLVYLTETTPVVWEVQPASFDLKRLKRQ